MMENRNWKYGMRHAWRRFAKRWYGLGLLISIGISGWTLAHATESAVACDATTGATCKVVGVRTTKTSATLSWSEGRHNGSRYFCYGIGTASKCDYVTSRASGVKNQVVTGLTPNTVYAYKFYGVYYGGQLSIVKGTFKTDSSSCGTTVVTTVEVNGVVLTATGDSLENVAAFIARKSDGLILDRDTTDRSGGYHFEVDPGTYLVTLSYPPFTAPAPYTATVVISKPLTLPDQIMKDAFQIGARTVASGIGDSVPGVDVTIMNQSDNSVVGTRTTDFRGHFSIGLKAGNYILKAAYGNALAANLNFTVTKSTELSDIQMVNPSGIKSRPAKKTAGSGSIPGADPVDAKGERLTQPSFHGVKFWEGR